MCNYNRKRVCIIGLDGVGLQNLKVFLSAPSSNNMDIIVNKGFTSSFISIPPYTPSAWTSIFTGVNPGKHGVYGFYRVSRSGNGFSISYSSSYDVMYPRVFEMATMAGLKSIVINVPLTYPADGVVGVRNVIIVGDWASPRQFAYPKWVEQKYAEYLTEPPHRWVEAVNVKDYVSKVEEFLETRLSMYYDLLEHFDFDLFVIVFSELDWLMHRIPEIVGGKRLNLVSKVVSLIDGFVGRAMELCDLIVLVSDHGFDIARVFIGVNTVLVREGLISYWYKLDFGKLLSNLGLWSSAAVSDNFNKSGNKRGFLSRLAGRLLTRILGFVKRVVPGAILSKMEAIAPLRVVVDYSSSKAFMLEPANWGVYVREGYENVVRSIFERSRFVKRVVSGRDFFWGPYVNRAPDLLLIPRRHVFFDTRIYSEPVYEGYIGEHEPHAMFAVYGDNVVPTKDVERKDVRVSIYDITPTILAYMGLPIPGDSDGRVLKDLFVVELRTRRADYLVRFRLAKRLKRPLLGST